MTRTRWAAVGAAVAITVGAVGISGLNIANADVSSGDRPVFISVNPCRLVDTRPGDDNVGALSAPIGPAATVTVQAHGTNGECTGPSAIPTDAIGLSMNVTAVRPTADTFLTFWGEGNNPGTSNLNPRAGGAPTPNSVSTPLSTTGSFNIYNDLGDTNVIIDVNGYYANHNHDDRYYTETESDERFVTSDRYDRNYTITAAVRSSGVVERVLGLPEGATLNFERQATGIYNLVLDGLETLESEFAFPIIFLTAINGDEEDCRLAGGGGTNGAIGPDGDVLRRLTTGVLCTDSTGNPANTQFNIAIHLEHG